MFDLTDAHTFVLETAKSLGAEFSSPWFYVQFGLMLAAAGPGGFLAGTAGGLVAHDHPFRWGLQQVP